MRTLGDQALAHLGEWIRAHWGEEVQLLSSEEEAGGSDPGTNATATEQAPRPVRVRDAEEAGDTRETGLSMDDDAMATMPDGDSGVMHGFEMVLGALTTLSALSGYAEQLNRTDTTVRALQALRLHRMHHEVCRCCGGLLRNLLSAPLNQQAAATCVDGGGLRLLLTTLWHHCLPDEAAAIGRATVAANRASLQSLDGLDAEYDPGAEAELAERKRRLSQLRRRSQTGHGGDGPAKRASVASVGSAGHGNRRGSRRSSIGSETDLRNTHFETGDEDNSDSMAVAEQILAALRNLSAFSHVAAELAEEVFVNEEWDQLRTVVEVYSRSVMVQFQGFDLIGRLVNAKRDLRRVFRRISDHVLLMSQHHKTTPVADAADLLLEALNCKKAFEAGGSQAADVKITLLAQIRLDSCNIDEMVFIREVNIFHYNAALNALATGNSWPRALSTLFLLCRRQLADKTSFSATITACSSERWPMAFSLISRHSLACLECDIVAVGAAAACGVPWPRASRLLASLQLKQVQVNVVACSALMASCEQSGAWARAIHGFRDMQLIGVQPNVVTYSTTTSSYNTAFLWRAAAQMVGMCLSDREVRVGAGGSRTVVCNSALGALSKSRQWLEVFNVLHDMRLCTLQTSRVSCSLAVECCQAKQWRKGVGILEHMALSNLRAEQSQATLDHASSAKHGKATRDNHSASAMVSMSAKNPHVCLAAVILWNNWVEALG
ncbi:unnamed protein product [Symbiodinium sp. KB8]|nr:unnamed protein product [Symbiodinium sp. KB8]